MDIAAPRRITRAKIESVVAAGFDISSACEVLKIPRSTLWCHAKKFGLKFKRQTGSERTRQIMEAIRRGVNTSPALAVKFGLTRQQMSVQLSRMASARLIKISGHGHAKPQGGRPIARWKVLEGTQ